MRLLIVGSLATDLGQAARIAMARGAEVVLADDTAAALVRVRMDASIGLILCDVCADLAGLIRSLEAERIRLPVIACGLNSDADVAVQAIRAGAREFLPLPPDPDLIAAILDSASADTHTLIMRDAATLAIAARIEQIATSDASVLITGESGTGKEVFARHIHRLSRRSSGPFIALNCAAIPEQLLESELFGHEKGAFSGALARRVGKFEAADKGTLLLDEIGEMDLRLQAKLLRAVQEREIDRVGGSSPVKISVRLLATTNRDLSVETAKGRFREDLFFRLNVIALRIPPLRDRRGDIVPLAEFFARRYAALNGLPERKLSDAARQILQAHAWRGNVRELENALHRAVLLAKGATIEADAIELEQSSTVARNGEQVNSHALPGEGVASLVGRKMEDVERDLILQTLRHTDGNRTHAAIILGISIRALRNKLRDYAGHGIAVPPPTAGVAA